MDPLSLCYSDDNKKNTFNSSGNNEHGLKKLSVNKPYTKMLYCCTKIVIQNLLSKILDNLRKSRFRYH